MGIAKCGAKNAADEVISYQIPSAVVKHIEKHFGDFTNDHANRRHGEASGDTVRCAQNANHFVKHL